MKNNTKYLVCIASVVVLILLLSYGGDDIVLVDVVEEVNPEDTLEGLDDNSDGVRDDVADYIVATYDDEPTQDALMQYAKAGQSLILSDGNETLAVEATLEMMKVIDCLYSMYSFDETWEIVETAQPILFDTEERIRAYLVANSLLGGHVFSSTPSDEFASMCE